MGRDITQIVGKKIKADFPAKMYHRFPESDDVKTLPTGKPSPVIKSYLPSGFFQVAGDRFGEYYIRDLPGIKVVEKDAEDDSGVLSGILNTVNDAIENTGRDAVKTAGFLREGFSDSVSDLGADIFSGVKLFKGALIIAVPLLIFSILGLVIIRLK